MAHKMKLIFMTALANLYIFQKKKIIYIPMFKIRAKTMTIGFLGLREGLVEFWLVEDCCQRMISYVDKNLVWVWNLKCDFLLNNSFSKYSWTIILFTFPQNKIQYKFFLICFFLKKCTIPTFWCTTSTFLICCFNT